MCLLMTKITKLHLEVNGTDKSGEINVPLSKEYLPIYKIDAKISSLSEGIKKLKLVCDEGKLNIDKIEFIKILD